MNAKEKAKELYDKFEERLLDTTDWITMTDAKQCALICVEELIKEHSWKSPIGWNIERKKFWELVKVEIEKL